MNGSLLDGKQKLTNLTDVAIRLQQRVNNDSKLEVDKQTSDSKQRYQQLCDTISRRHRELETYYNTWLQYEQCITTMYQWLDHTEAQLKLGLKPDMDSAESKIQLNSFKV